MEKAIRDDLLATLRLVSPGSSLLLLPRPVPDDGGEDRGNPADNAHDYRRMYPPA
ncbi:MAG TPA: hypothetical protein VKA68_04730 [bacterium]|nr:hypothetical protein [bacterium]